MGWFFIGSKRKEGYDDCGGVRSFDPELDEPFGVTHEACGRVKENSKMSGGSP